MKIAELCRHKILNDLFTEWEKDTVASEYVYNMFILKKKVFFLEVIMTYFNLSCSSVQ